MLIRAPGRRVTPERDGSEFAAESGPLRRCVVTRERQEKARMIRFVVGPDRAIVPDLSGRLPGRGLWLSARADVLEGTRARTAFARAARGPVVVPPDLKALVAAGLSRRIVELLGLARRAGQAVGGFDKAREWLSLGRAAAVMQASDGSANERARLLGGRTEVPVIAALSAATLGPVFGRDHLVHVALAPGRLCDSIRIEAGRLAGVAGAGADCAAGRNFSRRAADETKPRPAQPGHEA